MHVQIYTREHQWFAIRRHPADLAILQVMPFCFESFPRILERLVFSIFHSHQGTVRRVRFLPFPVPFRGRIDAPAGERIIKRQKLGIRNNNYLPRSELAEGDDSLVTAR